MSIHSICMQYDNYLSTVIEHGWGFINYSILGSSGFNGLGSVVNTLIIGFCEIGFKVNTYRVPTCTQVSDVPKSEAGGGYVRVCWVIIGWLRYWTITHLSSASKALGHDSVVRVRFSFLCSGTSGIPMGVIFQVFASISFAYAQDDRPCILYHPSDFTLVCINYQPARAGSPSQ